MFIHQVANALRALFFRPWPGWCHEDAASVRVPSNYQTTLECAMKSTAATSPMIPPGSARAGYAGKPAHEYSRRARMQPGYARITLQL
jgi:hypothetical protein